MLLIDVFSIPPELPVPSADTLLAALDYQGGETILDAANLLLRQGVAALLNSSHPGVDYAFTEEDILAAVNEALSTLDRHIILELQRALDKANNRACHS